MKNLPYTKEELKEIEKKINQAVRFAKKHKLTVAKCEWGVVPFNQSFLFPKIENVQWASATGRCCPGGAVLLANQPPPEDSNFFLDGRSVTVAKALGVNDSFMEGFLTGFDSSSHADHSNTINDPKRKQGYKLGYKLGRKLFPREVY